MNDKEILPWIFKVIYLWSVVLGMMQLLDKLDISTSTLVSNQISMTPTFNLCRALFLESRIPVINKQQVSERDYVHTTPLIRSRDQPPPGVAEVIVA